MTRQDGFEPSTELTSRGREKEVEDAPLIFNLSVSQCRSGKYTLEIEEACAPKEHERHSNQKCEIEKCSNLKLPTVVKQNMEVAVKLSSAQISFLREVAMRSDSLCKAHAVDSYKPAKKLLDLGLIRSTSDSRFTISEAGKAWLQEHDSKKV